MFKNFIRKRKSSGIVLTFFINLIFNIEWLALALVLYGLHRWIGIPIYFMYVALGIWGLIALCISCLLMFGSDNRDSLKTPGRRFASDRLRQKAEQGETDDPYVAEVDRLKRD